MPQPAVFLDRDNTLIDDPGFISSPDQVQLRPGAARALRELNQAGYPVVVVTNQSGVARGYFDERVLETIHKRVRELFQTEGARIDAMYSCPYLPGEQAKVVEFRKDSHLRKPKPGMLLQAAGELDLDLTTSWMIGDSRRDVQAGRAAGCRTILLHENGEPADSPPEADVVASSLEEAVQYVLTHPGRSGVTQKQSSSESESVSLLRKMVNFQERRLRAESHGDFSVLTLLGAIVQMLALACGVWGLFAMIEGGTEQNVAAMLRFLLACFTQLLALTLFLLARQR